MYKYIFILAFIVSGCSYFTFNGVMCDQIASDPTATIPTECRNYNEEMAEKASQKSEDILSPEDIITFEKK